MMRPRFPDLLGERAIIDVAVSRVASSCGFGVPRMEPLGSREQLLTSAERKGPKKLAGYRTRFKGAGHVPTEGGKFERVCHFFGRQRGTQRGRIKAAVLVKIESVAGLVSRGCGDGMPEREVVRRWIRRYVDLHNPFPGPDR